MQQQIADNLRRVQERIAQAAELAGRQPSEVTLVCVTKYVDAETTRALAQAGGIHLGESRPQRLWEKAAALQDLDLQWHLIGHLQRNKARRTVPLCQLIHSVDSLRLLQTLSELGQELSQPVRGLLEINVSGESAKHGFQPADLSQVLDALPGLPGVRIEGLMAMAGLAGDATETRAQFAQLRRLRDDWTERGLPDGVRLNELSMGMSGDFELAIAEGSTLVRVGSALFEGLA